MKDILFETLPIAEAERLIGASSEEINLTPVVIILLGGDRIACCDEAVTMRTGAGDLVGMATISPRGEDYSGRPEIVGLYILPRYRGKGYAKMLFKKTIERCIERGFEKIRVNVLSEKMMRAINGLSAEMKEILEVNDQSENSPIDRLFESES